MTDYLHREAQIGGYEAADEAAGQIDAEVRDVHPLVRLSPHYYNTEAEIGRTIDAVASLAAARGK